MTCTGGSHTFLWGSSSTGSDTPPWNLHCICGQYTAGAIDDLRQRLLKAEAELDRYRAALERCNALAMGAVSLFPPAYLEISMVCRKALEADRVRRSE